MAFSFDADEVALADGVEDLLRGRAKPEFARAVAAGEAEWGTLWEAVSELGIAAMAVPEELGGLGLGPIELVAVCERVGRHLAPAPIVATAGGFVPTLVAAGADAASLERVAAGAPATLAYVDRTDPATLELHGGNLHAVAVPLPDATRVELIGFVVGDREGEALSLAVVAADAVDLTPVEGFDRTRPLAHVAVDAAVDAIPLPNGVADLALAFATAAAELVGMGDRMLELAVEHARERHQFGVPIGSFQAVKHRLVDALVEVERARSLTYRAAVACAGGDKAAALVAARMAKAAASDAATGVGRSAIQVFGGIGITVEADVSLLYLRARQASMQLGGRDAHYAALAARGSTG